MVFEMNPYDYRSQQERMFDALCEKHSQWHFQPEPDCELCDAEMEREALERLADDDQG
jgi:hypothetical protein